MAFLDPYRVVDFTDERGLLAGRMLADLGADVVQVEPPDGSSARRVGPFSPDGESLYWEAYAANKRGVTCDLDDVEGRELALRLCADADFVFESETPGVMARRGLAYDDVRRVNPRVVYTSITPFGSDGPKAALRRQRARPVGIGRPAVRPPRRRPPAAADQRAPGVSARRGRRAPAARSSRITRGRARAAGQHVDVSAMQSVTQATLSRILATAVGDPQGSRLIAKDEQRKLDQSGSGSGTAGTKWKVRDGYVEMHLAIGPAAGRFTNNLFAWIREEGECDERLAALDWAKGAGARRQRASSGSTSSSARARSSPSSSPAARSASSSRRRSSASCSRRRSSRSPTWRRARSSRRASSGSSSDGRSAAGPVRQGRAPTRSRSAGRRRGSASTTPRCFAEVMGAGVT